MLPCPAHGLADSNVCLNYRYCSQFLCLLSMLDVSVLQALSKRIHYGMFVAEAKFRWGDIYGSRSGYNMACLLQSPNSGMRLLGGEEGGRGDKGFF